MTERRAHKPTTTVRQLIDAATLALDKNDLDWGTICVELPGGIKVTVTSPKAASKTDAFGAWAEKHGDAA